MCSTLQPLQGKLCLLENAVHCALPLCRRITLPQDTPQLLQGLLCLRQHLVHYAPSTLQAGLAAVKRCAASAGDAEKGRLTAALARVAKAVDPDTTQQDRWGLPAYWVQVSNDTYALCKLESQKSPQTSAEAVQCKQPQRWLPQCCSLHRTHL